MDPSWYNLTIKEVFSRLHSRPQGLTQRQSEARLAQQELNELSRKKDYSTLILIWDQFKSPLVYILLIAVIFTLFTHHYLDSVIIFAAVAVNGLVGFFQERKTSQALAKLKRLIKQKAYVLRDDIRHQIDAKFLVPGDVIWLKQGDRVPADSRLISQDDLMVNESALTGEWLARLKTVKSLAKKNLVIADQDNMIFMGTVIEQGEAKALVVATGQDTQLGKIASLVQETKEGKTPFQKRILQISHLIALLVGLIAVVIIVGAVWRAPEGAGLAYWQEVFIVLVAVAVAAIPEGLPMAITVILAVGSERILKRKAIIRKLVAVETVGAVSVVCADKTGTLTEGKMKVNQVVTGKRLFESQIILENQQGCLEGLNQFALETALLCSDAFVENPYDSMEKWVIRGRPTDRALFLAGLEACIDHQKLEKDLALVQRWSFSSKRMFLASRRRLNEKKDIVFVSGAPERLLEHCQFVALDRHQKRKLTSNKLKVIVKIQEALAQKGLRIIAVAYKTIDKSLKAHQVKLGHLTDPPDEVLLDFLADKMTFIGLISLRDPLRTEAADAISLCQQAGIRPIVITGDNVITAKAIAQELGIDTGPDKVLQGHQIQQMTDSEIEKKVKQINVYARISPEDKLRIVEAWQAQDKIVAMTGDGLNDAPALKKANVGIVMGDGVDVAKEVADLVLLDNSFSVIVAAIEQGRVIFDNIRKMITYLFSDTFTEALLIVGALVLGAPFLPILPAQILWANLIEDTLPNLALIFEPKEKDVMQLKPRGRKTKLINREMKFIIFIIGIITDILLLGLFWLFLKWKFEPRHIQTLIFAALSADSLLYVFSCRSLRRSLWQIKFWQNKRLIGAVAIGWLMLLAAVYLPPFQALLRTVPLHATDWLVVAVLGLINLGLIELAKWWFVVRKQTLTF